MDYRILLLLGALAGGIISLLTSRRATAAQDREIKGLAVADAIIVQRPKVWFRLGIIISALPIVLLPKIAQHPERWLDTVTMMSLVWIMGGVFLLATRRRIVFSREGIQVQRFPPSFSEGWASIREVRGHRAGTMSNIHFVNAQGRRVVVDATMIGWNELLKRLPALVPGEAKQKVEMALRELE